MQQIKHTHRERERERERESERGGKTQSNYTGSFYKPEVVMSPLHFQGEFTKNVISDYKCSLLKLARDFKCSSTTARVDVVN